MNGFLEPGNDLSWANKKLEDRDWERMNPTGLSARYADKTGRAEGWFRLKFQLDSSFHDIPIGVRRGTWAATDIYIDGNFWLLLVTPGMMVKVTKNTILLTNHSVRANIEPEKEHLLAIHFVDYLSRLCHRDN